MRRLAIAVALATLFTVSAGSAAYAVDDYPPNPPTQPTLAGSSVVAGCASGSPTMSYSVEATDPAGVPAGDVSLVLSAGSDSMSMDLGPLGADGTLSGSMAWPSASWSRGAVTATIVMDPAQLGVPLSYPTNCGASAAGLAATGATAAIVPIAIAGGLLTAVGIGIVLRRRSTRA